MKRKNSLYLNFVNYSPWRVTILLRYCDRTAGHRTMELCCFWSWFLRPSLVWLCITLIYCRDAWRLLLEDQGGSLRVKKTARNCGWGRCCNYDLRRLGMHGGGGAGNSKARRKVLERQILEWEGESYRKGPSWKELVEKEDEGKLN